MTRQESLLYDALLLVGPMPATELALLMDVQLPAVYRLANSLKARHIVIARGTRPKIFEAVPVQVILHQQNQMYQSEQAALQTNLLGETLAETAVHEIELLSGRTALYDRYIVEAEKATSEILVFAIGVAYNAQLQSVQETVRQNGVEVRHIVQHYGHDNFNIIQKWKRIGVKLRYYQASLGFHLMIFDAQTAILSLSNPEDTEQRTSMILRSPAAVQAMRDYYFGVWGKSRLIN